MRKIKSSLLLISVVTIIYSCSGSCDKKVSTLTSYYDIGNTDRTELVYITPYGERYHCSDYFTITGHEINEISRYDAEKRGRTPCKKCHPYKY